MTSIFGELRRRNVVKVAVAYAIVGWLLVQVAATFFPALQLPEWTVTLVAGLVILGFPLALILSWAYELTPDGMERTKSVPLAKSIAKVTGRKLDFVIIGLLVLAVGFLLGRNYVLDERAPLLTDEPSIAVLPFVNISSDPEQEYFSDGISEELLNLLAQVPNFRVISRSSAFSFKGKGIDIPTIAEQLNVDYILEGSVRKSGDQVRINVQLIDARSDAQLWSETYTRNLDDIFAVQDEIAASVLEQLQITLLGAVPKLEETNPEAYSLFLQGRHIINQSLLESFPRAEVLLQQALAIDPNYLPALSELARLYVNEVARGVRPTDEGYRLASELIDRAVEVAPDNGSLHGWLGWLAQRTEGDLETAARHFEQALAFDPTNLDVLRGAIQIVKWLGYLDESILLGEYLIARDPTCLSCYRSLAEAYRDALRLDEVVTTIRAAQALAPGGALHYRLLGEAFLLKGDAAAALTEFQQIEEESTQWGPGIVLALHDLGRQAESAELLSELRDTRGAKNPLAIAKVYAYLGETDAAFEWLERALETETPRLLTDVGYNPIYRNLHADSRWEGYLQKLGISAAQLAAIDFHVTLPE